MKKKAKIALAALGAAATANAVHAAVYRPKKVDVKPIPEEKVNVEMPKNNADTALIEYKESFFIKFKNFIFKILHINK